jgi:acetate kinase
LELCRHDDVDSVDEFLNEEAGWEGMSNGESLKSLVDEDPNGFVVKAFVSSVAEEVHRVAAALNGVDTLIFTGGVGENNAVLRRRICDDSSLLDTVIDDGKNRAGDAVISSDSSPVEVCVVEADEAATMIAMVRDHA